MPKNNKGEKEINASIAFTVQKIIKGAYSWMLFMLPLLFFIYRVLIQSHEKKNTSHLRTSQSYNRNGGSKNLYASVFTSKSIIW